MLVPKTRNALESAEAEQGELRVMTERGEHSDLECLIVVVERTLGPAVECDIFCLRLRPLLERLTRYC